MSKEDLLQTFRGMWIKGKEMTVAQDFCTVLSCKKTKTAFQENMSVSHRLCPVAVLIVVPACVCVCVELCILQNVFFNK